MHKMKLFNHRYIKTAVFICFAAILSIAFSACSDKSPKRVIAVLPVDLKPPVMAVERDKKIRNERNDYKYLSYLYFSSPANAEIVRGYVTDGLMMNKKKNKFRIVDTNFIDKVVEQHNFEAGEWSDANKIAEIGKSLNADTLVITVVSPKSDFKQQFINVSISVLDINTMEVLGKTAFDTSLDKISKASSWGDSYLEFFGMRSSSAIHRVKKMKLNI